MEENEAPQAEMFPLDEITVTMLAEYDQQAREASVAAQAVLNRFLREHKLTGNWSLAASRRELVRAATNGAPVPKIN